MTQDLTVEHFKNVLPAHLKGKVNSKVVGTINKLVNDPVEREHYRDNLLGYTSVLDKGIWTIEHYTNAVRYITCTLLGDKNEVAYAKTFPDRYQNMIDKGKTVDQIRNFVAAFNRTKIVNLIREQSMIAAHVYNADVYQKAINTQAQLMISADSEKVRCDAADSLMKHLKPPEVTKVELDIGVKEVDHIADLRNTLLQLGEKQLEMIKSRTVSTKDIAHSQIVIPDDSDIIEGEVVDE